MSQKLVPYERYKDSGVEWLGQTPEGWQIRNIATLTTKITNGFVGPTRDILVESGIGYLQSLHIKNNKIIFDEPYYVSPEWSAEHSKSILKEGDVLIVQTGDIGQTSVVTSEFAGFNCHALILLEPISEIITGRHLAMVLNSSYGFCSLESIQTGSTLKHLNCGDVRNISIPVPPISVQNIISSYLDKQTSRIDALVKEQEELILLLKEKRQALISHAVTKGIDSNAKMKPSGVEWLGDIPEGWNVLRIATLFSEVNEEGIDGLPILSVSIHDGVSDKELNDEELDRKVTRSEDKAKYKRVKVDDLVYNMMRAWQGGFGAVKLEGMVSPAYVVARPKVTLLTSFVEQILRTPQAIEELRTQSRGITDFRLRLYWDEFKSVKIAVPSIQEQFEIMTFCESESLRIDALVAEAEATIVLMQEHRSALISAVVTGKVRVPA